MQKSVLSALFLTGFLVACAPAPGPAPSAASVPSGGALSAETAAANFIAVVEEVEPVAEATCRTETAGADCDYLILIDDRADQPPNAYQTLDDNGRPVIAFTVALIADARNRDEQAFILGHEAAHHIAGHIPRTQQNAAAGAFILGAIAALGGAGEAVVQQAANVGATVGARSYSKEFELEADAIGTRIAHRAGYDPVLGADYFSRLQDPGNQVLGTHPPNAERIETVRRVAVGLN